MTRRGRTALRGPLAGIGLVASVAAAAILMLPSVADAQDTPSVRRGKKTEDVAQTSETAATTTTAPAEQTEASPVTVVLTYQDQALPKISGPGGGMTGRVQNVAEQLAAAGKGQNQHAVLTVRLMPRYERIGNDTYVAKVDMGEPSLAIDPRIAADIRALLQNEARQLLGRLSRWSHPMSEQETRQLLGYLEKVAIKLDEPFGHIRTWRYEPTTLTFTMAPMRGPTPIVDYVEISPEGVREVLYVLRVGQAFWVEARFSESPGPQYQSATVEWPGGSVTVPIERTDHLLVYRGGPFYIAPPPLQEAVEAVSTDATAEAVTQ